MSNSRNSRFKHIEDSLKIKDEENIAEYLLRVDEIVNLIWGLGEEVEGEIIVQNMLRSLPLENYANISSIQDNEHLDKLTTYELHGILTTYEMRIGKEMPSRREATFTTSKGKKNHEHMLSEISMDESNEEDANFKRKLNKGYRKYKGKLPSKCFNYGKVRHFSTKCPYWKK